MSEQGMESKGLELISFREEIKHLRDKNDSLRLGVANVEDLGQEENDAWEKFKSLLKSVGEALHRCAGIEEAQNSDELKNLLNDLKELENSVKQYVRQEDVVKNANRKEFFAWLNNRLVLTGSLSVLFPEDIEYDEDSKEEDLLKAKELVDRKIVEFCS